MDIRLSLRGSTVKALTPLPTRHRIMVVAASILHEHHAKQMQVYRGSTKGRRANMQHNLVSGHALLYKDYFHLTDPVYKEHTCRRRYRMSRDMFMVILRNVRDYYPYF
jgi:hypothetical protein